MMMVRKPRIQDPTGRDVEKVSIDTGSSEGNQYYVREVVDKERHAGNSRHASTRDAGRAYKLDSPTLSKPWLGSFCS
jgi:hypothetical protein